MGILRQFHLTEDKDGTGVDTNIVEQKNSVLMRVFPVDNYDFPEEVKRQAKEWHVLKVPLLGQQVLKPEQAPDWCGRTSASMVYNYFQLIKGGDPRGHYITHSRAGDPECLLELRYPGGERAFIETPYDPSLPKNGWTGIPEANSYEIQSSASDYNVSMEGEIPLPVSEIFPGPGKVRPEGVGAILRYQRSADYNQAVGHLLPTSERARADEILNSEELARERFAHILTCLRANNPVVIYTGIGFKSSKSNPRHIIVISGYVLMDVEGVERLFLVTADPSTKYDLATTFLPAPQGGKHHLDLGSPLQSHHALFRMRSGKVHSGQGITKFASLNLVRATAFFGKNPDAANTEYDRFLDHAQTHCGRYIYREKKTEVPPEVVDSSFSRPKYSFPLRGSTASSHPWQCYYNNESLDTGIGGYYVLGLQRNLHGGVHLFPPTGQDFAPVNAVAPGYVVAARLPGERSPSLVPGVAEALGNWPGFVLLRHEVQEAHAKEDPKKPGRRGTFYTLYMHLRSPVFPKGNGPRAEKSTLDRYFTDVPWFRALYKQRFGSWVSITHNPQGRPGTVCWSDKPVDDEDRKPSPPEEQRAAAEPAPPAEESAPLTGEPSPAAADPAAPQQPEPEAPGTKKYPALTESGASQTLTVRDARKVYWLYKPAPGNVQAAMEALAEGKVVTFDEPFFPVDTGEVVGFVGPLPGEQAIPGARFTVPVDPGVPGRRRSFTLRSGFLHFQLFCPEEDKANGIKLLTELAELLDTGSKEVPTFVEVREDQEDNFLEVSDLENHLKLALPEKEQEPFVQATAPIFEAAQGIQRSSMNYAGQLAAVLDSSTSFAPEADRPDWRSPCCRFAYPLTLEVETLYLPRPEQNRMVTEGNYELELGFEQEMDGQWRRIECPRGGCGGSDEKGRKVCKPATVRIDSGKLGAAKNGVVTLSLMVPAMAERMTLKAKSGFFIEQAVTLPGADGRLLAQGITRRWRNVRLVQKNEWTPESVTGVMKKVNEVLAPTLLESVEKSVGEIAWWDAKKEAHLARLSPLSKEETPKPGAKLFQPDGMLAPGSRLESLHPVTGVWLLNVLDKQKKAWVRDEWTAPSFRKEDPSPLYAGWVVKNGARRVGDTVIAAVIDEDFGYDKENRVTLLAQQEGRELVLARGREFGAGGNIFQEVQAAFWGDWSLVVTDTSEPPQTLKPKSELEFLAPKLTVSRPKLVGEQTVGEPVVIGKPQRQADGSWRWLLQFQAPAPQELSAFILLKTDTTETGPGTYYPERVLPVIARPIVDTTVPFVDAKYFVLKDDFIVGLTEAGQKHWEAPDLTLHVVKELVRYRECFTAMDIRVAWSVVQGLARLAAKKVRARLVEVAADGLSVTVSTAVAAERLEVAGAREVKKAGRAKDGEPARFKLTFEPATCEEPKLQNLWVFDEARQYILNRGSAAADAQLGPHPFREYQTAYRAAQPLTLHTGLATALGHVAKALGKKTPLVLERIEGSGMSAIIDASAKGVADKVRASATSGGFEVTEADVARKSRLRLTANPASRNWLAVSFHPGRIFESLTRSELAPGTELFYRFELVALNGQPLLHPITGGATGEGDGSLTLAAFQALEARTSQPVRATHTEPGRYRKVGLRDMVAAAKGTPAPQMAFKPAPRPGQCELEISICATGAPEDLNQYTATFFRKALTAKKWEALKGFTKLKPEKDKLVSRGENGVADWLLSARVPYPPYEKGKKDGSKTEFKVELTAAPGTDCEPRQLEVTGMYDFKPRWEGKLTVEVKDETLELRCHGEGIEVPVPGSKDKSAWSVAREFELAVQPDEADPHLVGVKPKLSAHIQYATPTADGKRGGCNLEGDFVATLDLKALEPGVAYTFSLQRYNNRPVREAVMDPVKSEPFTRPQAEE
ncbi:hypothetical protein ACLESO_00140 [Pyxidicoccus sp. 3LG]